VCNTLKIENPTSRIIHNAVESKVIKENPRVAKVNVKVRESLQILFVFRSVSASQFTE